MSAPALKPARILVADDEADLREILFEQLRLMKLEIPGVGCVEVEVEVAENGAVALRKASEQWFDAILTDVNMPQMSGIEFLADFRALGKDTPVLFLTAFGDKSRAVEALRLGSYDFLDKPWRVEHLRKVVGGAVEVGYRLRAIEEELEAILSKYKDLTDERRRQLRTVHRSMLLMRHGFSCDAPDRTVVKKAS